MVIEVDGAQATKQFRWHAVQHNPHVSFVDVVDAVGFRE
jgi:hypothetical protein